MATKEQKELTPRRRRELKFLLWMGFIVNPILVVLFYVNGGAQPLAATAVLKTGFDTKMPPAKIQSNRRLDKMDYYENAEQDSLARAERERTENQGATRVGLGKDSTASDPHVRNAQEKMAQLGKVMSEPSGYGPGSDRNGSYSRERSEADVERMERAMGLGKKLPREEDPEISQLSAVVDKLIEAEHPGAGKDSAALKVKAAMEREALSVRAADSVRDGGSPVMEALAPDEQSLTGGDRIQLELSRDLLVGGELIPRGTPLYGNTSLSGERLLVSIRSISRGGRVYPVLLQVYDQDGLEGIYIPGVPGTDALRESGAQEVSGMDLGAYSPTLAGQAAGAGIQAARSLIGKKIRRVRVVVPADYRLILKDGHKTGL